MKVRFGVLRGFSPHQRVLSEMEHSLTEVLAKVPDGEGVYLVSEGEFKVSPSLLDRTRAHRKQLKEINKLLDPCTYGRLELLEQKAYLLEDENKALNKYVELLERENRWLKDDLDKRKQGIQRNSN